MINRSCVRSTIDSGLLEATQRQLDGFEGLPELAAAYRLLGDPTRLRMLTGLAFAGELCVCDLADILEMDPSAISHNLRKLRDGELVTSRREGATIYYRLVSEKLRETLAQSRAMLLEARTIPVAISA